MPKVRLDPVVKFRQQEEDRVRLELARASENVRRAEAVAERIREQLLQATPRQGRAWELDLADASRSRCMKDLRAAEAVVASTLAAQAAVRTQQAQAHQRTEAVRRVADRQREDLVRAADHRETQALDELAGIRSWTQNEKAA